MAGSIQSDSFSGEIGNFNVSLRWELFYGNNDDWIIYGSASQVMGVPNLTGSWDVTITLGTGETDTFTISPVNVRTGIIGKFPSTRGWADFYKVISFATPAKDTTISVRVTSSEHESLGVGNFSGSYVAEDPSASYVFVQNTAIKATARNDFTWSFNVTMDVIQDDGTALSGACISAIISYKSSNDVFVYEKNGTRKISQSAYGTNRIKYHYEFTLESQSTRASDVQSIKGIYETSHPEATLSLTPWLSLLFIWSDGNSRVAKIRNATASTELKIVTPPPTVSTYWFTVHADNYSAGGNIGFSLFIKNKSRAKVTFHEDKIDVSNLCGATIEKYKVSLNGTTYSVTNTGGACWLDTNVLTRLGENILSVSVVDTRSAEYAMGSATVFVYDYAEPTLSNISAYRCDSAGIQNDNGTYLYLRALASVASVDGRNSVTLKARYKPTSGSYGDYTEMENNRALITGGGLVSTNASYTVEIVATDTAGFSSTYGAFIPSEIVLFSLKRGGRAVGVGMHVDAEDDYTYHVAFDTYLHRDLILGNGTRLTEEQLIKLLALI